MKKFILSLLVLLVTLPLLSQDIDNIEQELVNAAPEYINKAYENALYEFESQNYDKSLEYIRHVIKSDMQNYNLRYLAAHNYWKKAGFESATIHFQTAIAVKRESPNAYMDLALMKIHERNYYYAEQVLQTAIYRLNQYKVSIPSKLYNIYTRLELLKGYPAKALYYAQLSKAAFDQSGTGVKDKLEAVTLEARSQLLLENFDKAELAAQWAITLKENNVYAYNLLGHIYSLWSKKIAAENEEKSKELKNLAIENFNIALKSPNIVDEYKAIIETSILNLK